MWTASNGCIRNSRPQGKCHEMGNIERYHQSNSDSKTRSFRTFGDSWVSLHRLSFLQSGTQSRGTQTAAAGLVDEIVRASWNGMARGQATGVAPSFCPVSS